MRDDDAPPSGVMRGPAAAPDRHSRRAFLAGSMSLGAATAARVATARLAVPAAGAVSALAAACGIGGDDGAMPPTVVGLFSNDHVIAAGRTQRIPIALVAPAGVDDRASVALPDDDDPIEVVIRADGEEVDRITAAGHVVEHDHVGEPDPDHQHADLFRYYPLRTVLPRPGIYDLTVTVEYDGGATESGLAVQAFDPDEVDLPLIGDPFPTVDTPTVAEPDGVDRLCTRFEPCPFHDVSAADAMADGRPLALLVATPAFCSTAYCGPVLETLIDAAPAHPDLAVVHVEVYANPDDVDGNFTDPRIRVAPAVERLGLGFEPSLFLVGPDGVVADRIDNVFDRAELDTALAELAALAG